MGLRVRMARNGMARAGHGLRRRCAIQSPARRSAAEAVLRSKGGHRLLCRRGVQLAAPIICQLAVSSVQFSWTLFVLPIQAKHQWSEASIQVAASILAMTQCFVAPAAGYAAERLTHRGLMLTGGALMGASWFANASAASLPMLYLGGLLGGAAYAIVRVVAMGHVLKWFPERRGVVAGLTSGAMTAGAMMTTFPIMHMIASRGYEATFQRLGALLSLSIIGAGALLVARPGGRRDSRAFSTADGSRPISLRCALRSPIFYLLYLLMVVTFAGGMFLMAHLAAVACAFRVATGTISWRGVTSTVLPLALSAGLLCDSAAAALFGWLSDRFSGRAPLLLAIAFLLEAASLAALPLLGRAPGQFVLAAGLAEFAWGAMFGVFPVLLGDLFGPRSAIPIYGFLWTGKAVASLLIPLGAWLAMGSGGWGLAFRAAAGLDVIAAVLALVVLLPACGRAMAQRASQA